MAAVFASRELRARSAARLGAPAALLPEERSASGVRGRGRRAVRSAAAATAARSKLPPPKKRAAAPAPGR